MSSRLSALLRLLVPITLLWPLATTGCGVKGPPHPPLPRAPEAVRGLDLRQSGDSFELRWSAPTRREDGEPIEGALTYLVLARVGERPPAPSEGGGSRPAGEAPSTTTGTGAPSTVTGSGSPSGAAGAVAPLGAATAAPGTGATGQPPAVTPPALGGGSLVAPPTRTSLLNQRQQAETMSHLAEEAFVRSAVVVARIGGSDAAGAGATPPPTGKPARKTPPAPQGGGDARASAREGAGGGGEPSAGGRGPELRRGGGGNASVAPRLTARIEPRAFAGTRLISARIAFAVVAVDARSRRSPARPILEIDPIAPLPAPQSVTAVGKPEGVLLTWSPLAATAGSAGSAALPVDVYRAVAGQELPAAPIAGSPFPGPTALDRGAKIGESYTYTMSFVLVDTGKGRREGAASEPVRIDYLDRFPPGPPVLVTAERIAPQTAGAPAGGIRISWSAPIDSDVAGYRIYRAEAEGVFALVGDAAAEATSWTDPAGKEGRLRYCVTAIDAATPPNESDRSEVVEVPAAGGGESGSSLPSANEGSR